MTAVEKTSHQHTTENEASENNNIIVDAVVLQITDESGTVKRLILGIENKDFTFKPGQWVDTFIPGLEVFSGFSICSSPGHFRDTGEIELAVQYSTHPPAHWVHTKCSVGSKVKLKVGGDFYYYAEISEHKPDLLLIGGGVGINPLISTMRHAEDLNNGSGGISKHFGKLMILYSARTQDELLFHKEITEIDNRNSNISSQVFVTKEEGKNTAINYHRITADDIAKAFVWLNKDVTQVFICGPSPMISAMENILLSLDIKKEKIHFETWWIPQ